MKSRLFLGNLAETFSSRVRQLFQSPHKVSLVPTTTPRERCEFFYLNEGGYLRDRLVETGLWMENLPLRLHLGCGQVGFSEYVNIDYPPSCHNIMKSTQADLFADIRRIRCEENAIDEIRLHHVFEHFSRVDSLALFIQWHGWLKQGGLLVVEVPDFEANAKKFIETNDFNVRSGIVRHLVGDQSSEWGFHIDQWWPERLSLTLTMLGFEILSLEKTCWTCSPYLSNITLVARVSTKMSLARRLEAANNLLSHSLVGESEKDTYEAWQQELANRCTTFSQ